MFSKAKLDRDVGMTLLMALTRAQPWKFLPNRMN